MPDELKIYHDHLSSWWSLVVKRASQIHVVSVISNSSLVPG